MSYGPATSNDPRMLTNDGVNIVDGGYYYNYYDGEWVTVEFGDSMSLSPTGKYWDGWFTVRNQDERTYTLNGERMASTDPKNWR